MSTPRKYASGITASDLNVWLQQVSVHHGLVVLITIEPSYTSPSNLRAKVALYDVKLDSTCQHCLKSGQALVKAAGEGQWGQILHLAHLVLNDYLADPWCWTVADRRRETQARPE